MEYKRVKLMGRLLFQNWFSLNSRDGYSGSMHHHEAVQSGNALSLATLWKAFVLGLVITLMSVPRIVTGGLDLWLCVPVALMAMTLISQAAIAWGHRAGMYGVFPSVERALIGTGLAGIMGLILLVIYFILLDPVFRQAFSTAGAAKQLLLRYPKTIGGALALVLWAAGFETMLFQAGAISFFSRLSNHQWLTITGAVSFRCFVTSLQLSHSGIVDSVPLFLICAAASSTLTCLLYVRAGLPAAMLFSAVLSLRVLGPVMAHEWLGDMIYLP